MDKELYKNFLYAISFTTPRIQSYLQKLSEQTVSIIQEIRLRVNSPIVIVTSQGSSYLTNTGKLSLIISLGCVVPTENEIYETVNKMCGYSMHSHYEDLLNGYITLPNGSRVGVCGTAVFEKDKVKGIDNISSVNIRIPRAVRGVANELFENLFLNETPNIIIAGAPSTGKTTMLRDIALQLGTGRTGKYFKVCVIDERKELFPRKMKLIESGANIDVLLGFPKIKGIPMAVRSMSPEYIICDEIGGLDETEKIIDGINCGVSFVLSMHAKSIDELRRKQSYKVLVNNGDFLYTVMLESTEKPCKIERIYNSYEVLNEAHSFTDNCHNFVDFDCYQNKAN